MKKRRLSFRIEDDEAVVVAPMEWWEAVADHFEEMYKVNNLEEWYQATSHVREWIEKTRDKRQEVGD